MKRLENDRIKTILNSYEYQRLLDFLQVMEYKIPVLFPSDISAYSRFEIFDCYDINRGVENHVFKGPVIAHAPCKVYSTLRSLAYKDYFVGYIIEKTVSEILNYGGIVEHTRSSLLWQYISDKQQHFFSDMSLTSVYINMKNFGFVDLKPIRLSVVYKGPLYIPPYPLDFDAVTHVVGSSKRGLAKKELNVRYRSYTPVKMIFYMVSLFASLYPFSDDLYNDILSNLSDDLYNNVVRYL